jgi:O-antigen/teichoic acid export membrane protein
MTLDRKQTMYMISELSIVMWAVMLFVDYCAIAYSVQVVQLFTGKGYLGAATLIGACGFIYVLSPQNRILQDIIGFNKKTWIISSGALIMALCSITLNFYLVPKLGYIAAPYVFIASTAAQTIWLYVWALKLERLQLHWGKAGVAFIIFFCFVILSEVILEDYELFTKLLVTAIYSIITYLLIEPNLRALKKS